MKTEAENAGAVSSRPVETPIPDTLEELGAKYDEQYYRHGCGPLPYDRSEPHWGKFFGNIASHLIQSLNPRSVLDAGCAMGFLVEAFWDRGVEACGIDISPFAIEKVRRDMQDYCRVGSISHDIQGVYDLITCIEVLEHMREADALQAIEKMCGGTDTLLFSSTPDDLQEPTHFNVRPLIYWLTNFQKRGFVVDLGYDASFVTPHAVLLRRSASPWPPEVLQTFVALYAARKEIALKESRAQANADEVCTLKVQIDDIARASAEISASQQLVREELSLLRRESSGRAGQIETIQNDLASIGDNLRSLVQSRTWRALTAAGGVMMRFTPRRKKAK